MSCSSSKYISVGNNHCRKRFWGICVPTLNLEMLFEVTILRINCNDGFGICCTTNCRALPKFWATIHDVDFHWTPCMSGFCTSRFCRSYKFDTASQYTLVGDNHCSECSECSFASTSFPEQLLGATLPGTGCSEVAAHRLSSHCNVNICVKLQDDRFVLHIGRPTVCALY